jgi:hypothetical protein
MNSSFCGEEDEESNEIDDTQFKRNEIKKLKSSKNKLKIETHKKKKKNQSNVEKRGKLEEKHFSLQYQ